jgi:hypothetical protein
MDVSALSTDSSRTQLLAQVGTAVLSEALDNQRAQGAALLKLLPPAPLPPEAGKNVDLFA